MYCDDAANLALNIFSHCGIIPKLDGVDNFSPATFGVFVNLASFWQFATTNCYTNANTKRGTVGYFGTSSDNILQIVQQLVGSCLGAIFINRNRQLDIKPITIPPSIYPVDAEEIGIADIIKGSLRIEQISSPSSTSIKLEYNKNHSPTDNLAGSVFEEPGEADRLVKPSRIVELTHNSTSYTTLPTEVVNAYNLPVTNSKTFSSLISNVGRYNWVGPSYTKSTDIDEVDSVVFAEILAALRLNYMCRRSVIVEVPMTSTHWNLDLGEVVNLAYYRYGMKNIPAIVVSRSDNVVKNIYKVKLLI
jgi:hypothetical protein